MYPEAALRADELPEGRLHSHGVLDPQSRAREYRNAAGGAAATNAGQPWNVVAALANDAGGALARRIQGLDFRNDEVARERYTLCACLVFPLTSQASTCILPNNNLVPQQACPYSTYYNSDGVRGL